MSRTNRKYTYEKTINSLEILELYVNKILNKKSYHLKYLDSFNTKSLDALFTAIKYTLIDSIDIKKLDSKELSYHFKFYNLTYFINKNKKIRTKEHVINYLFNNFKKGNYFIDREEITVGSLLLDIEWVVDISNFLINSTLLAEFMSNDLKEYTYKILDSKKIYEYKITKSNKSKIKYSELLYLYDITSNIKKYNFKKLQDINSTLNKEGYILSINKIDLKNAKIDREYLSRLDTKKANEYIKSKLLISDRDDLITKRVYYNNYELLRCLVHAYEDRVSITKCRKFTEDNDLILSLYFAKYYINYSYDYNYLSKYYNYEDLKTMCLRPVVIDYNSSEYRKTLDKMSNLSKKIVKQNEIVNKHLRHNYKNMGELEKHGHKLSNSCNKLYTLVKTKKLYKAKLDVLGDDNKRNKRTLIDYLTESIYNYNYKIKDNIILLDLLDNKQMIFKMNITTNSFKEFINNEDNKNKKINFYNNGSDEE